MESRGCVNDLFYGYTPTYGRYYDRYSERTALQPHGHDPKLHVQLTVAYVLPLGVDPAAVTGSFIKRLSEFRVLEPTVGH